MARCISFVDQYFKKCLIILYRRLHLILYYYIITSLLYILKVRSMKYAVLLLFISFYSFSQVNPLALVNSAYDEQNPVLSPDGKTLYLTIANHPQNIAGKKDPGDIWVSVWVAGNWSAPVHAGSLLNNRGYNGVAGISPDGSELYLLSHYTRNGDNPTTQGIAVSQRTGSGWSAPQNIS